jgi:AbrB family looped-hinge helix DNA binding protein
MKSHTDAIPFSFDDAFYGTSTMGERGQLVIPAEARADLDMGPGDKLLIMRHPIHKGLMLFKLAHVKQFLDDFSDNLNRIENEEGLEVPAE